MRAYLNRIDEVISRGKYKDTWESLQQYRVPEWVRDGDGLKIRALPAKDGKPVVFKIWID